VGAFSGPPGRYKPRSSCCRRSETDCREPDEFQMVTRDFKAGEIQPTNYRITYTLMHGRAE